MSYKPFKMKGSPIKRNFGIGTKVLSRAGSLFKFTEDDLKKKTYPKGYTKKDIEFLKEQNEDVVRSIDYLTRIPVGPTEKENKELTRIKGSGPHGLFDMENPKDREKLYNITEKPRK